MTDPRLNVYQWAFDSLNRLFQRNDEVSASSQCRAERQGRDRPTTATRGRWRPGYVRNGFSDVIQRTSPDSGTTVYEYNALGKPSRITDGRGIVTNLTYDSRGRLLTREYPAATAENIAYTWDSVCGRQQGQRAGSQGSKTQSGSIEQGPTMRSAERSRERKTTDAAIYNIDYAYDVEGNITEMVYPSGRIVTYSRDSVGRITGVTTKENATRTGRYARAATLAYMPFGPLAATDLRQRVSTLVKSIRPSTTGPDGDSGARGGDSITILDRLKVYADGINLTGIGDNLDAEP